MRNGTIFVIPTISCSVGEACQIPPLDERFADQGADMRPRARRVADKHNRSACVEQGFDLIGRVLVFR
jgi:hypothetical protein